MHEVKDVFNELEGGTVIVLLCKSERDKSECKKYKGISLFNGKKT